MLYNYYNILIHNKTGNRMSNYQLKHFTNLTTIRLEIYSNIN